MSQMGGDASSGAVQDFRQGKLFATLSYVVPFFLILPLVQRTNVFATFHARQALVLWIAAVLASVVITLVRTLLSIAILARLVSLAFTIAVLGLMVLGALNAWNGRRLVLPVLGPMAEKVLAKASAK